MLIEELDSLFVILSHYEFLYSIILGQRQMKKWGMMRQPWGLELGMYTNNQNSIMSQTSEKREQSEPKLM